MESMEATLSREEITQAVLTMPAGTPMNRSVRRHLKRWAVNPKLPAVWKPSENIADAWWLLEYQLDEWGGTFCASRDGWTCQIGDSFGGPEVEASTAPLAICRASLLFWILAEKEHAEEDADAPLVVSPGGAGG